jgi:hypothetical protein
MTHTQFYLWLTGLTFGIAGIIALLMLFPAFADILPISIISSGFFVILCILVFYLGNRAAKSENKYVLTRLILGLVFIKILACLGIVIVYDRVFVPTSNYYMLPFFLIYLVYTIFEVVLLTKANKLSTTYAK